MPPFGKKGFLTDRTEAQLWRCAFFGKGGFQLRVYGKDGVFKIPAVSPCPAFVEHIAGAV